jgi:sulfatase modifying factor 1
MPRLRFHHAIVLAGLLAATTTRAAGAEAPRRPTAAKPTVTTPTVALPAGSYRPLYSRPGDAPAKVAAFRLDRDPVTRGAFLAFVRANPQWRRGATPERLAARDGYLADWRGDLDAGDARDLRRPVTGVSWYAAGAYCAAQGRRLPTLAEWEYAAAASETARDAARDPRFIQRLVSRYASRGRMLADVATGTVNAYGVRGLHDFAWEWTADDAHDVLHAHHDHGGSVPRARAHDLSCAGAAIGAIDPTNYPAFLRYAMRAGLAGRTTLSSLGFRCAS